MVRRAEKARIPYGDLKLNEGDQVYVLSKEKRTTIPS
jgi:hypothetical protein